MYLFGSSFVFLLFLENSFLFNSVVKSSLNKINYSRNTSKTIRFCSWIDRKRAKGQSRQCRGHKRLIWLEKAQNIRFTKEDEDLPQGGVFLDVGLKESPGSLDLRVSIEFGDNLGSSSWRKLGNEAISQYRGQSWWLGSKEWS